MDKKFRKHLLAIAFFTTALTSAFVVPNVYAGIIGDDCERSMEICTPSTSEVCYYWMEEPQLPCIVEEYEYIDRNDNENEQGDVNR